MTEITPEDAGGAGHVSAIPDMAGVRWSSVVLSSGIVAALTAILTAVWSSDDVDPFVKGGATAVALGLLAFAERRRQIAAERTATRRVQAEAETKQRAERRRAVVLKEASTQLARVVARFREVLAEDVDADSCLEEAVKICLAGICDVFKAELPIVADMLDPVHFTATVFELNPNAGARGTLERKYWHYPGTRPRTPRIDIEAHHGSAAARCVSEGSIVVMESANKGNFEELRSGQRDEYEHNSMFCLPIWRGVRETAAAGAADDVGETPELRGVLTVVAVGSPGLFRDTPSDRAFLTQVAEPFCGLIRLAYLLCPDRRGVSQDLGSGKP